MNGIRAVVTKERWSGHGEGGTLVKVEIQGWGRKDLYDSTPEDYARAEAAAAHVNECLPRRACRPAARI